jgi:DNA-binding PadR family transcriptional regulator
MPRKPDGESDQSDPALLILASLASGPKHGYAIVEDVRQLAGIQLGPGTLYGAMSRLESRGLIEPLPADDRRRPYRITGNGSEVLRERLEKMQALAEAGLGRLSVQ